MAEKFDYDLIVIGAGPGGYVAAIRAAQLGMKVAVVEKDKPGGVCLNWGCIPSKALIHQAQVFNYIGVLKKTGVEINTENFDYSRVYEKSRKAADTLSKGVQFLFKKNKVEMIEGRGIIKDKNTVTVNDEKNLTAKNILIATGARPRQIPGFEFDGEKTISSREILALEQLPGSLFILGAGAIGVEFAYIMRSFGVEVHMAEMMDQILPLEDEEIAKVLQRSFKKMGIKTYTSAKAEGREIKDDKVIVTVKDKKDKTREVEVEKVLVAVGRVPNSEDIGLENLKIETEKGFIPVGDYYQTSVEGVYAIGDVINTPLLAHLASKEGEIAVE
ncbi:MAG: dihydrolipoyl dehydrogenase family protein, partial [Vulcanimicrobiota bacterium]